MREYRTKAGDLMYYVSRAELEALPGYRGNNRQGRACCPIHDGDNPTALSINWETGWARCFSCGDAWRMRIADHPDAIQPRGDTERLQNGYSGPQHRPRETQARQRDAAEHIAHDLDALQAGLERAIAGALDALPASPGAAYLESRGIPLDVALELGIGWGTRGALAERVVFPLSGPDGHPTSATGRTLSDHVQPKYKALSGKAGYLKTLFNGRAIAWARRTGHPLIVVEGPLDAAACHAAGLPLAVALGSTTYAYPEHFDGLSTAILALDSDAAGQEGRRSLWLDLTARGVEVLLLSASALDGCKDLGEYWQRHRTMPAQLIARSTGPHLHTATPPPTRPTRDTESTPSPAATSLIETAMPSAAPFDAGMWVTLELLKEEASERLSNLGYIPATLPAQLRAEAEEWAFELIAEGASEACSLYNDLIRNLGSLEHVEQGAAWYTLAVAAGRLLQRRAA